jgi:RNA polymerase sigma-70 factor (ECF subfamily)
MDSQSDDTELLAAFGDERTKAKAFECILDKYHKKVYWLVRRIVISHDDADDVSQNTFVKIWTQLDSYRGESKLYTWIFRIATNEALLFIRKRRPQLSLQDEEADASYLASKLTADSYFDGNKLELKLQQAILTLPDKQRLVFNMKYYENLKYEEMSQVLNTSVGALKASYHHAVKKIETFMKAD